MTTTAPGTGAAPATAPKPLLEVEGVTKYFPGKAAGLLGRTGNPVKAVDGVSFVVHEGETSIRSNRPADIVDDGTLGCG